MYEEVFMPNYQEGIQTAVPTAQMLFAQSKVMIYGHLANSEMQGNTPPDFCHGCFPLPRHP